MPQPKEKPNRWVQFKDFLALKQKESNKEVKIEGLPENMVKLILDKKLKEREIEFNKMIELINIPVDTTSLNSYIEDLTRMVEIANATVCRIAIPYIRAGDSSASAKLTSGWSEVYSFFIGECIKVKTYWGDDKPIVKDKVSIRQVHVRNVHISLINHYFKLAFKVLSFSFKDLDVRPSTVTVIMNMQPAGFGGFNIEQLGKQMRSEEEQK